MGDQARVVIVEDEYIIAHDLEMQLEKLGYSVIGVFAQGEQAVEKLKSDSPDLILMDIKLKGELDGIQTAEQIREDHDLPVVYVSALTDAKTLDRAKQSMPYGYLVKPFNERTLSVTIETALYKHQMERKLRDHERLLEERVKEQTKELTIANGELARANRLKDEFMANMSHELRTPLNTILGMCEVLSQGVVGKLNPGQAKSVRVINESSQHLLSLINDVLDVSKIQAGKLELSIRPIGVQALCDACLRFVRQTAAKKRIRVNTRYDSAVHYVYADELRIKQILVNLLSNAVKFTLPEGDIGLEVRAHQDARRVEFLVWDTGIGMDEAERVRVFNPFEQVDSSLSRSNNGTGLGLALVRKLVELHKGAIAVDSAKGEGSTFSVRLPWRPTQESTADGEGVTCEGVSTPGHTVANRTEGAHTVLLADDNEANVETLKLYLHNHGYNLVVASDGEEAVEKAQSTSPDLILMDIQMPNVDGLEAIRRIRTIPSLRDVPIFAVTALAMQNDYIRCKDAGATEYFSKPLVLKEVAAAMHAYLDGDSASSSPGPDTKPASDS